MSFGQEQYLAWQKRLQRSHAFRRWWQFASNYSWLLLVPAGWYLLYYAPDNSIAVKIILAFVVARFMLVPVIAFFWPKPRPYQEYKFEPITSILFSQVTDKQNSFPSRHVISLASASGVLLIAAPIWFGLFFIVTIVAGLGRVILGYHYPSDVIAAIIFGLIIGSLTGWLI